MVGEEVIKATVFFTGERRVEELTLPLGTRKFDHRGQRYVVSETGLFVGREGILRRRPVWRAFYRAGNPDPIVPSKPILLSAEDMNVIDFDRTAERGISAAFRSQQAMRRAAGMKWLIIAALAIPIAMLVIYFLPLSLIHI